MMKSRPPDRPFVLVVGVDLEDAGGYALDQAAHIAARIDKSELHILHVGAPETSPEAADKLSGRLRLYVAGKTRALGGLPGQVVGIHLRLGAPSREIVQLASDVGADLVVLGTHQAPQLKSLFVGSVAERVMGGTFCTVVLVGPKPPAVEEKVALTPPCPDCVRARFASRGKTWWCARHAEHHHGAHTYSDRKSVV